MATISFQLAGPIRLAVPRRRKPVVLVFETRGRIAAGREERGGTVSVDRRFEDPWALACGGECARSLR
jgi:hypothetical protein